MAHERMSLRSEQVRTQSKFRWMVNRILYELEAMQAWITYILDITRSLLKAEIEPSTEQGLLRSASQLHCTIQRARAIVQAGLINVAVRTIINNLFIGVTRGYRYKMRYVYAHFPINVNLEKNADTGLYEVEIRNFIGEKVRVHSMPK